MSAIYLMITGAVFGFLYGLTSYALPFVPDVDVFTATGIGFGLGAGAGLVLIGFRFIQAAGHLVLAVVLLVAPIASWIVSLVTDPLGRRAKARQAASERARIDAIYPPPDDIERRRHAET